MKIVKLNTKYLLYSAFCLVKRVFDEFVAPDYSAEGIESFFRFVTPEYLEGLHKRNGFVLGAFDNIEIIGMIALRDMNHISLFFVDSQFQRKGIGRKLFNEASSLIRSQNVSEMVVHSSPFAVPSYQALGFSKTSDELVENGIRYIPMHAKLNVN